MESQHCKKTDGTIKLNPACSLATPSSSTNAVSSDASKLIDFSKQDLIRLLSYLESELQARDVAIAAVKSEAAKLLLYQAKYGRLGLNDPFAALQRDSSACSSANDFDEASIGSIYETQLCQLEKLINVQKKAHTRAKQLLSGAEKRHVRTLRELEDEKRKRANESAQGDDVCMLLEKERERLKLELEAQKQEQEKLQKEIDRLNNLVTDEKSRHKQIVLCLLQDRRRLAVLLSEERTKNKNATLSLADQAERLKREMEQMKSALDNERRENADLRQIAHSQERDLNLIRQTILAKAKQTAGALVAQHDRPPHELASAVAVVATARQLHHQQPNNVLVAVGAAARSVNGLGGEVAALTSPTAPFPGASAQLQSPKLTHVGVVTAIKQPSAVPGPSRPPSLPCPRSPATVSRSSSGFGAAGKGGQAGSSSAYRSPVAGVATRASPAHEAAAPAATLRQTSVSKLKGGAQSLIASLTNGGGSRKEQHSSMH